MKTKFLNKVISTLCAAVISTAIMPAVGAIKSNTKNIALADEVKEIDEKIDLLRDALKVYESEETLKVDDLLKQMNNLNINDDNKLFLSNLKKSIDPLINLLASPFAENVENFEKTVELESQKCYNSLKKLKENVNDCDIAVRIGFEDAIRMRPKQNFNDNILKEYKKYYDAGYESGSSDIFNEKLKTLVNEIYYSNDPIDEKMKTISKILELRNYENYIEKAKVILAVMNPLYEPQNRHHRENLRDALVDCIKTYIDKDMQTYENVESAKNLVQYIQQERKDDVAHRIAEAIISSTFKDRFDSIEKLELLICKQLFEEKEDFKANLDKIEACKIYKAELNYIAYEIKNSLNKYNNNDAQKNLVNLISNLNTKFNQVFRRFANLTTGENTDLKSVLKNFDFDAENVENAEIDEIDNLNRVLESHPQLQKIRDSFCNIIDEISGIDVDESKPFNERVLAAVNEFEESINLYIDSLK